MSPLAPQDLVLAHRQQELASLDRRAQVEEARIAAARVQEDHQFQYAQRHLDLSEARQSHHFQVTWALVGLLSAIALLIVVMAFFGAEDQRQVAVALGRGAALLVAGYGLAGVGRWLRRSADDL